MEIAYSAERSVEDEISRVSSSELGTVAISYVVMFLYIAIALGRYSFNERFLVSRNKETFTHNRKIFDQVESKMALGVSGVLVVLISVLSSIGVCGYAGIPTTLLTIEVVPFLVLAVGVDNIFIMVQTHQRTPRNNVLTMEQRLGETLAKVGPSMLLTSSSEIFCFAIGTLSSMPAVNTFAIYATLAVFFDFVLQITVFVALLAFDTQRYENNRMEILCKQATKEAEDMGPGLVHRLWDNYLTPLVMK